MRVDVAPTLQPGTTPPAPPGIEQAAKPKQENMHPKNRTSPKPKQESMHPKESKTQFEVPKGQMSPQSKTKWGGEGEGRTEGGVRQERREKKRGGTGEREREMGERERGVGNTHIVDRDRERGET